MDKIEKQKFVDDILDNVKEKISMKIGKMLNNWDGIELRQYISDIVREEVAYMQMNKDRRKEYENDRLVLNL
ncbi:MAG: hypothetical protein ACOCQR_03040 [bacterium]